MVVLRWKFPVRRCDAFHVLLLQEPKRVAAQGWESLREADMTGALVGRHLTPG